MYGLVDKHVLVAVTGSYKNVLLITPPMCFTMENARYNSACHPDYVVPPARVDRFSHGR